ncbi:MAG: hypothetical protein ABIK28_19015 [Planctomycetota bacterium]
MRKICMWAVLGALVMTCITGAEAIAQNAVVNPFFSTQDLTGWTGTDPSLKSAGGSASLGLDWYCCYKNPGTPNDNGSISQELYLLGGRTYDFSANIAAAYYCSS